MKTLPLLSYFIILIPFSIAFAQDTNEPKACQERISKKAISIGKDSGERYLKLLPAEYWKNRCSDAIEIGERAAVDYVEGFRCDGGGIRPPSDHPEIKEAIRNYLEKKCAPGK